jgi:hypothetical protein
MADLKLGIEFDEETIEKLNDLINMVKELNYELVKLNLNNTKQNNNTA